MNPQLGSRAGRSEHLSSTFAQGSLDDPFFLSSKLLGELRLAFRLGCKRLPRKPGLVHREILCFAHDDRSFDDVLEFANITWPRVRLKKLQGLAVHPAYVLAQFPRSTIDEVLNQRGNIFPSFAQSRHLNRKNAEAVKQVATKVSSSDGRLQIAVGSSDHADIRLDGPSSADALKFMFLEDTQKSDLGLGRELSDFIEKNRASFRQFKAA